MYVFGVSAGPKLNECNSHPHQEGQRQTFVVKKILNLKADNLKVCD
jgi:hypothetical protein